MLPIIGGIIKGIGGVVGKWISGRHRIKEAKINAEVAKWNAEASYHMRALEGEINWDLEAMRQSRYSWKDEWITILLSVPFIGCFIPYTQEYVVQGFRYLQETPMWYQLSFVGIVAASFGLRWLFSSRKWNIGKKKKEE